MNSRRIRLSLFALLLSFLAAPFALAAGGDHVSGAEVMQLTREYLQAAPKRYIGSPGHAAAEQFIRSKFAPEAARGNFIQDDFSARTPNGLLPMRNLIVKFPGKKDGIIVLVSHYETNYPLKDINFVGANDGACTTALLIAIGQHLRVHPPDGYSVWLVFDDGEEAIQSWSDSDSLYGTKHLAAKWIVDGTSKHVKAVMIADMIGDKDLNIMEETQSTQWLRDDLRRAAKETGHSAAVFKTQGAEQDDHLPFLQRGMPTIDIIDVNYGPLNPQTGDSAYHHTVQDNLEHISTASLQTSADLFMAMIRLINER